MALNKITDGVGDDRVKILAAGAVTGGTPRYEAGFFGIPETSVASGSYYAMHVEGTFEIAVVGSPNPGDAVYITRATQALTLSSGAGNTPFAKVVALPSGAYGTQPKSGKMWVRLLPQLAVQP